MLWTDSPFRGGDGSIPPSGHHYGDDYTIPMPPPDGICDDPGEYLVRRDTLREFNAILQRDATDTTYKYALLRALVEIAEQESHHVRPVDEKWVSFPLGLIVERWLYYYWAFVERRLPQRNGESPRAVTGSGLAFRRDFERITDWYKHRGAFARFVLDLRQQGIPTAIEQDFTKLIRKLRHSITRYPMKHLGHSKFGGHYQLVTWDRDLSRPRLHAPITRESLIAGLGRARLLRRYFETFRAVGGFATGSEAIFTKWARFTSNANLKECVSFAQATDALLTVSFDDRNVRVADEVFRKLIAERGHIKCVWSGDAVSTRTLAIDHVIPYSLWGNNALWNLLPATRAVNGTKSDRIPTPDLIEARRGRIVEYWEAAYAAAETLFRSDFRVSLAGMQVDFQSQAWPEEGISALQEKCAYLITERGFEAWSPGA